VADDAAKADSPARAGLRVAAADVLVTPDAPRDPRRTALVTGGDAASATRLSPALRFLCLAMLAAGVALRADGLARKPLWYDEAATLLHLSGRRARDLRALYDGRPLHVRDVAGSGAPPSVAATVRAVAADEPQIGPGYFAVAALWGRLFGVTRSAVRALSATAAVVTLPLLFALARDLGGGRDVGLAAAALAAVSPLHLRYAQEARPYALWIVTVLAAMVAIRHAAARSTAGRWALVAVLLAAALLVQPLTMLALPAFAAAAIDAGSGRRFGAAAVAATAAAAAWVVVAWHGRSVVAATTDWAQAPIGVATLARDWLGLLASVFYRPGGPGGLVGAVGLAPLATALWLALGLAAAVVTAVALAAVWRGPRPLRRIAPLLVVVPWGAPALLDLVLGGRRSTVARYVAPAWIGLELAVAWWATATPRPARRFVLAALLLLGAATALRTRPLDAWWDTDVARQRRLDDAARRIAALDAPVVASDLPPLALIELVSRLDGDTALRLGAATPFRLDEADLRRLVLLAPSDTLLTATRTIVRPPARLVADGDDPPLWRVATP